MMTILVLAVSAGGGWSSAYAADQEMVIKAVMIRKFVEFIKWPAEVSPANKMQVNVCVYGTTGMSDMDAVFSKTSSASPIKYTLKNISQLSGVAGQCHVVFLASSKASNLSALASQPVLSISDGNNFAENGGMIGFQLIDGKIRYNINNAAFDRAGLKVDAQLLEIANKVVE